MSTNRVAEKLSSSLSSISSLRFAVEGISNSKFTVTDTRKCSKTCSVPKSSKRRDSEFPLPSTKPSRPASCIQAVYDWEASQLEPKSNQAEGSAQETTAPLIAFCYKEEATTETENHGRTPPFNSFESIPDASESNSFSLSSTQSSMTSSQLLLRGFRQDLDEEVQMRIIKEYRKECHAAWTKLHPTGVSKWPKRQQAIGLALLVVEAFIHMRKVRAVHRTPATRAQLPPASETSTLDITDVRNAFLLLHDVFLLVDNNDPEADNYDHVRSQLREIGLWQQ